MKEYYETLHNTIFNPRKYTCSIPELNKTDTVHASSSDDAANKFMLANQYNVNLMSGTYVVNVIDEDGTQTSFSYKVQTNDSFVDRDINRS